jgi:hypothetical protein
MSSNERKPVDYDPERDVYRSTFVTGEDDPCIALVETLASIEERDPLEIDPLGNSINMDAVENLLQSSDGTCEIQMTFQVPGYHTTIKSEGIIELQSTDISFSME